MLKSVDTVVSATSVHRNYHYTNETLNKNSDYLTGAGSCER